MCIRDRTTLDTSQKDNFPINGVTVPYIIINPTTMFRALRFNITPFFFAHKRAAKANNPTTNAISEVAELVKVLSGPPNNRKDNKRRKSSIYISYTHLTLP